MRISRLLPWLAIVWICAWAGHGHSVPAIGGLTHQARARPALRVIGVHPSGETMPETTLRISIELAEPVHRQILDSIELRRDDGTVEANAFLNQELWSPDQRTLTLLLDPGRVKRGLIAHDTLGCPLRAGTGTSLVIAGKTVRRWRITAGSCTVPDPSAWQINPPSVGSSEPLAVALGAPIDAQSVARADPDRRRQLQRGARRHHAHRW